MADWEIRLGDHQWPRQTWRIGNGNCYSSLIAGINSQMPTGTKEKPLAQN